LAASNLPWDLDHALLRRLEKRVIVNLPNEEARIKMIKKFIPQEKQKDLQIDDFVKLLDGYSGSDIRLVCKEALMKGVRRAISLIESENVKNSEKNEKILYEKKLEAVTNEDFRESLKNTKPASLYRESEYIKWMEKFGSF
jgi:katanin p60 ATPase-containing subunit A1